MGDPSRAFRIALVVAALLHAPFIPLHGFAAIVAALFGSSDYDDKDAKALIPIDLDLGEPEAQGAAAKKPVEEGAIDAGVMDGGPSDAGVMDAGPGDAGPKAPLDGGPPADAGDGGPADAGPPPIRDPIVAAGGAGSIAAEHPNVQVLIQSSVIRKHELGSWFSRVLVTIPEWQSFFTDNPLDPVNDIDHLLITGPRLKGDTSKMVAVMDVGVSAERLTDVVGGIVKRNNGAWLDDAPEPIRAAHVKVGGAERIFAIVPNKKLLVILPEGAKDQLDKLKKAKGFRTTSAGVVISLMTPARPFADYFPLPKDMKKLRLVLTPTKEGADLAIEAIDASPADAKKHAPEITRDFEARRKVDMGITLVEVLPPVTFTAEGAVIRGSCKVPMNKLRMIMSFVEQKAKERMDGGAGKAPSR